MEDPTLEFVFEGDTSCTGDLVLSLSRKGQYLCSGGFWSHSLYCWDYETREKICRISRDEKYIQSIDFSYFDEIIASSDSHGLVQLWKLPEKRSEANSVWEDCTIRKDSSSFTLFTGDNSDCVSCVRFSPFDRNILLGGSKNHGLELWDIGRKIRLYELKNGENDIYNSFKCLTFLDSSHEIAVGDSRGRVLYNDLRTKKSEVFQNWSFKWGVGSICYHRNTQLLACTSASQTKKPPNTNSAFLFDLRTRKMMEEFVLHTTRIVDVDFHPSGNFLITGSHDCTAKVFDIIREEKATFQTPKRGLWNRCARFSSDGKYFAIGDSRHEIELWKSNISWTGDTSIASQDLKERTDFIVHTICEEEESEILGITILLDGSSLKAFKSLF